MKKELRKFIETRFVTNEKIISKKHYIIATILNPRFIFYNSTEILFGYYQDMMEKDGEPEASLLTNIRDNLITDINGCELPPPKKFSNINKRHSNNSCV